MEALRVYNSDSDSASDAESDTATERTCDSNECESLLESTINCSSGNCTTRSDQHSTQVALVDNHSDSMKRKQSAGYISRRKSARLVNIQQESLSVSSSLSCISVYLSSTKSLVTDVKQNQRQRYCTVPSISYVTFNQHTKPVLGMHWHPSDDRLLLSCSLDGTVRLWDALQHKVCIATYKIQDVAVKKVIWITNSTMVSAGYDHYAFHTDVESGRVLSKMKHNGHVTALAVHPKDSNSILTGNARSEIHRWDLRCCKEVTNYKGAGGQILDILFLKGGDQFVASSDTVRSSQAINVWDYVSGVVLSTQVYFEPYSCPCLRLHPTESVFLAQSNANYLTVFSSSKPYRMNKYKRFEGHSVDGNSVGFDVSSDGSIICTASVNGMIKFYDYLSTKTLKSMSLATSNTLSVEWHPCLPSTLAVSSWDGQIFCLR